MGMLESPFQSKALSFLNNIPYCKAENVSGNARQSGRPDVNGCYKGRMFKIELKIPDHKNVASKKQSIELRRWARSGAIVGVIYSMDTLRDMFYEIELSEGKRQNKRYEVYETNGCTSWYIL